MVTESGHSSLTTDGQTVTVWLTGELDLATVEELREVFDQAFAVEDVKEILVDLTDVEFVDSTALGALVAAHRRAGRESVGYLVVNVQPRVERLLAITGTLTLLTGAAS